MAQVVFFKISCIVKWTVGLKSMRILNFLAIHFHVSKNFPAKILIMNFLFDNTFTFTFTCFANKFQSRTFRCYKKLADWSGGQRHGSQRPTLIHDFHFFPPMSRVFFSPMSRVFFHRWRVDAMVIAAALELAIVGANLARTRIAKAA
jgi:hypothetical protein